MSDTIEATFEIASWDENSFDEQNGLSKLTEAVVKKNYSGDIEGSSVTRWVMAYGHDENAVFVGLERIVGTIGTRTGSVVLQHLGRFAAGSADADLLVVSGTGELDGASGTSRFKADPSGKIALTLK